MSRPDDWNKHRIRHPRDVAVALDLHVDPDMLLPGGATCGQCVNFATCKRMAGRRASEKHCEFSPSRFALEGASS